MRCVLVLGGPKSEWIDKVPMLKEDDYIVACDGGYPVAIECGWIPRLAVGDFDSYKGQIAAEVEIITAPPMKDDTDAMMGLRIALERGCDEFLIVGALGGRLDHTLANLQMLAFLCAKGIRAEIYGTSNYAWTVKNGTIILPRMPGWHLSIFAWGSIARVSLYGVVYPLTEYTLTPEYPLGVSNEFAAEEAKITAHEGMLLVIASKE